MRLTGFGIASRLVRERQSPHPPETIAGTLAYMAPEQTGRMNRSIDSRSDLYALGVTFYQMLTGALPFTAADPMEWVHCHLARRPMAPAERLREIPGVVSAIVMKLLAKRAEDRYQTAAGLESDLRRCQTEWKAQRRVDDFPLGEHDTPDRLLIPEKLYGRRHEVETLLAAFDRVVKGGAPELVLVSGYSGIGKSSVVNELQPVLVPPRGLFAAGKFDQYKRDVPYSTLAQAFQSLVRPLLAKSDVELGEWREALREALGSEWAAHGGPGPGVETHHWRAEFRSRAAAPGRATTLSTGFPALSGCVREAGASAGALPRRSAMARCGHARSARRLANSSGCAASAADRRVPGQRSHCSVIRSCASWRQFERPEGCRDIKLGPLTADDLGELVADTLRIAAEQAVPLAELVHAKTDGNPVFRDPVSSPARRGGPPRVSTIIKRDGRSTSAASTPNSTRTTSSSFWSAS